MIIHYKNGQYAREFIKSHNYKHLVIPTLSYYVTESNQIVVEAKIETVSINEVPDSQGRKDETMNYLDSFRQNRFCDISLGKNADFLKGTEQNPQIAIYDLDCRKKAT